MISDEDRHKNTQAFFEIFKTIPFNPWTLDIKEKLIHLIEEGIGLETQDNFGDTPLHRTMTAHNCEPEIIQRLIKKGADTNVRNKNGETPLHCSVIIGSDTKCVSQKIQHLLNNGADINAQDGKGNTLLNGATSNMRTNVIELLFLNTNAKIGISNNQGDTPLKYLFSETYYFGAVLERRPVIELFLLNILNKIKSVGRLGYLTEAFEVTLKENWDLLFDSPEQMIAEIYDSDEEERKIIIKLLESQYDNAVEMGIAKEHQPAQLLNRLLNNARYTDAIETTEIEPMPVAPQAILYHPKNHRKDEDFELNCFTKMRSTAERTVSSLRGVFDETVHKLSGLLCPRYKRY